MVGAGHPTKVSGRFVRYIGNMTVAGGVMHTTVRTPSLLYVCISLFPNHCDLFLHVKKEAKFHNHKSNEM